MRKLTITHDTWPLDRPFTISRGSRTEAHTITAELCEGPHRGHGECVPYARYGETMDSVHAQIDSIRSALESGTTRQELQTLLPAGAARNAVDCAIWDLDAKLGACRAWDLAGIKAPVACVTAATISLDSPDAMGKAALELAERPLLKVKLNGEQILERVRAVHQNAPSADLIVDANEAWDIDTLRQITGALSDYAVRMIEQPLPAGDDSDLSEYDGPITLCADESSHTAATLHELVGRYGMVNLKLDKTGGLTEGFAFVQRAKELGFEYMVGCMVGTSLAMAPGTLLTQDARFVDLDGPLWLAKDRVPPLDFGNSLVGPPPGELWG